MAALPNHTFNLFPHYPQLPFALFILHLFILNQFILHLISSTLSTIIHILPWFWTYCIASVCHWTASVGVGVGEEGIVDAGEEEVSWVDRCL